MNYLKWLLPAILAGSVCALAQAPRPPGKLAPVSPAERQPTPAANAGAASGDAEIKSSSDFENLCTKTKYTYWVAPGNGVDSIDQSTWDWYPFNGFPHGPLDKPVFEAEWYGNGQVSVKFKYTSKDGSLINAYESQPILLEPPPLVTMSPTIAGASGPNLNYLPPSLDAKFTANAAGPAIAKYVWSAPSCFVPSGSTTTLAPSIDFADTGTCGNQVCVVAVSQACGLSSPPSCSSYTRMPTLPPLQGPAAFCKAASANYCVEKIRGISSYQWSVPAGWTVTPAGNCAKVDAPANLTANQTGNIEVYGTLAAISSNTGTQTKAVTVESGIPKNAAKHSPTIRLEPTPTAAKKRITVSFDKLPFPFRWSAKATGIGTGTTVDSADGGPRTFLVFNNQYVDIRVYTQNSCGILPGNQYAYWLKNGAMVPVELN